MAIKKALVIYGGSIEELHDGDSLGANSDVTGPSSAVDNAIARFDGTTGKLIQESAVTIDDNGSLGGVNSIKLDTTPTVTTPAVGEIYYDEGNKTPSIALENDVNLQLGQEIVTLCYNGTGSTILNGSVVAVTGAQGQRPSIVLADADSESTSARTLGIATQDIANGAEGFITSFGFVRGIDTSAITAGYAVYLSQTAGAFTATKPSAPAHLVHLGYVIKSHADAGEIFVTINNGWEFDELHDVLITDLQSGQVSIRDQVLGVWKNITINGTTGEVTVTSTKDGITISLPDTVSANITGNAATVTNGLYTTDLGVSVQSYDADLAAIAALSGTNGLLKKTALNTWTLDTSTYLTSYTETDPVFSASAAAGITSTNISNWNTAYSWGNHASAGYLDNADIGVSVQAYDADIATVQASQAEMEAGTEASLRSMSPLKIKQAITALAGGGGGFSNMQVFTSNGTFTVPTGITKVKVTVVGGGGGSGGANSGSYAGCGGAGGGAAIKIISGLTSGSGITVTVGGGGGGGNYHYSPGGTGGTSSFGAYCSATGGAGGQGGGAAVVAGALGGIGSGGDMNIRGGYGGKNYTTAISGDGGNSILGGGAPSSLGQGTVGQQYGGGASGSVNNKLGSAGGAGVVIVEY